MDLSFARIVEPFFDGKLLIQCPYTETIATCTLLYGGKCFRITNFGGTRGFYVVVKMDSGPCLVTSVYELGILNKSKFMGTDDVYMLLREWYNRDVRRRITERVRTYNLLYKPEEYPEMTQYLFCTQCVHETVEGDHIIGMCNECGERQVTEMSLKGILDRIKKMKNQSMGILNM